MDALPCAQNVLATAYCPKYSCLKYSISNQHRKVTMRSFLLICAGLLGMASALRGAEKDILFADFEGDTYGDWKTVGTAFGKGPAKGALPRQMQVIGFRGK